MRYYRIIHVLPEERFVVKSIESNSIGASSGSVERYRLKGCPVVPHSFSRSNCDFFGMTSSI